MSYFQNIPVLGRLLGKLLGYPSLEVDEEKQAELSDAPSFPDYMLDPDAVVSFYTSQKNKQQENPPKET